MYTTPYSCWLLTDLPLVCALQLLLDAQRTPLLSPLGFPMALSLTGAPYTGPAGEPLFTTPDGKVLLGEGGQPLLAPGGQMLGLGAHGNLLQADGNPLLGPGKQRMYLGPLGTATAAPGGSSHHQLARRLQGGAGSEEAPLPVLRLGPVPVVCSGAGAALVDALGRPLVAGPLGSLFSYHKGPASWWWAAELWKTASALAATAATRRGEAPLGRAGSVLGDGWGTRHTHLPSQYGTAVEGEEGEEEDLAAGEEEEEPDSPGAWPPAAVEYVAVNKAGMAVRSTKQPSGQWPSSSQQQLEGMGEEQQGQEDGDWGVVPMQTLQPPSVHSRATHASSQQQGIVSSMAHQAALAPSTTNTTNTGVVQPSMPASVGAASVTAGSLAAASLQQQQQQAASVAAGSSSSTAAPGQAAASWPHWVEGLLLMVQLSLAQHAVLLPWAEAYSGLLHLAQLPLVGAAVTIDEWLVSSAAAVTAALHQLAHHPGTTQAMSVLGSSATALAVLLGVACWLVLAYPHDQYLQGELDAMDPSRQAAAAGTGPAALSSQRVSGWWLEAVSAASGAGAAAAAPRQRSSRWAGAGSGRGPAWGGYPPTATAAVAQWLLAAWPLPQAALAAGLLLVALLRRLLPALQLLQLQRGGQRRTTGGMRRSTTDLQATATQQQQQQQQKESASLRPALFYISGAWLIATLALASAGVLLSSPWGLADQQATLQQLPYLRQAADLAALYAIHDPAAARGGRSGRPAMPQPTPKLAQQPSLQRPGPVGQQRQQPTVPLPKVGLSPGTPKDPTGAALRSTGSSPGSLPVAGAGKGAIQPGPGAGTDLHSKPMQVSPSSHIAHADG
jgi:hypothetical protein